MRKSLLFSIFALTAFTIVAQDVVPVQNGDLYSLSTGDLYFEVNASFGAQVSSFKVGDQEILYFSGIPGDYLVGSTLWPSPQSVWEWPPSTELDSDPYTAEVSGNEIIMESQKDPVSKLIFKKTFSANSETRFVTLKYQLINDGTGPYSVAGWEVTRVPAAGGLTFFPSGESAVTGDFASYTELIAGIVWYEHDGSDPAKNKFFADGEEGWLAHVNSSNYLFIKKINEIPKEAAAPGEAEIEFWYATKDTYVELENQSQFLSIPVGNSLTYTVEWYAEKLPAGMDVSVGSAELIGHVRGILSLVSVEAGEVWRSAIFVYPNPVSDHLYIKSGAEGKAQLEIYDITAKLVLSRSELDNKSMVDVSGLHEGVYFYSINHGEMRKTGKLVVR